MEAKTALELWNDGVEGRLNFQLYRCDIDSLMREGRSNSPLRVSELDSSSYEESSSNLDIQTESRMTSSFLDLDSTSEEESFEDVISDGRVTSTLPLFDHADSPAYEELFEQNWQLFEGSDEEFENSCANLDAPEYLSLVDSPKVLPEPTCLTKVIQAMVMYPPSKVPKKRKNKHWAPQKKILPPRKTGIMVSDDENDDEVELEVEDPSNETVGCEDFKESSQPEQSVCTESWSYVCFMGEQDTLWQLPFRSPTSPVVLPLPVIAVIEPAIEEVSSFDEHLARCAVDWDYPRVLFEIGGYALEPISQKMLPPQTEPFTRPGSDVFEQKLAPALGASNGVSRKKRYASSSL